VANYYRIPPWQLDDVPEDEVIAEAEYIDVQNEIANMDDG
jgi:hypothetical protein